jgi:hypothetical protein
MQDEEWERLVEELEGQGAWERGGQKMSRCESASADRRDGAMACLFAARLSAAGNQSPCWEAGQRAWQHSPGWSAPGHARPAENLPDPGDR